MLLWDSSPGALSALPRADMWLASWAEITIRIDEDDVRGDASCDAPKIRTVSKSGINK
jgi:hypothetical protein